MSQNHVVAGGPPADKRRRARVVLWTAGVIAHLGLLGGGIASAQTTFPVPATQTAMIQADGPKQGPTAARYFNVEGKSHDLLEAQLMGNPGLAATVDADPVLLLRGATCLLALLL